LTLLSNAPKEVEDGVHFLRRDPNDNSRPLTNKVSPSTDAKDIAAVARLETAIRATGEAARLRAVSVGKNYFTRAIEKLGALFGKRIVWVDSNGLFDGVVNYRSDKDTILIDPSSTRGAYVIVGHEIGYHLAEESPNAPNDGVAGTVTVEAANETFGRITGKWNKSSPAFLHDTFASAPDYVQQAIRDSGGDEKTGGVYVNGEVHVIRENHESAEALERTLLHEENHASALPADTGQP
jgi:hypothetical protein